jgi:endonuclease/exonuclease/phosphatase family metal-dependent hydrolase
MSINLNPTIPTIIRGDFNTHARSWLPHGTRQSPWALNIKEWAIAQNLDLMNQPGAPTRRGSPRQSDTTLNLIWTNEAAVVDDSFHDLVIDFAASLGSDHAGLWTTIHLAHSAQEAA